MILSMPRLFALATLSFILLGGCDSGLPTRSGGGLSTTLPNPIVAGVPFEVGFAAERDGGIVYGRAVVVRGPRGQTRERPIIGDIIFEQDLGIESGVETFEKTITITIPRDSITVETDGGVLLQTANVDCFEDCDRATGTSARFVPAR